MQTLWERWKAAMRSLLRCVRETTTLAHSPRTPHETQKVISTLNWIAENHPGYAPPRLWDDEEVANDYAAEAGEVGKVQR